MVVLKEHEKNKVMLDRAQSHADMNSTCKKVQVGSVILTENFSIIRGCNHGIEHSCRDSECLRVMKYGENSKLHRLPSDCAAIHSEVDAICEAAEKGVSLLGATIFVTRYPCEACARAIALSGIRKVVYGRKEKISKMTEDILSERGVTVVHEEDWMADDDNS